jgi:arylformamidase
MTEYRASFDAVITEHLTGLAQLPGASFTAVPLRIEGLGTIPVRACARLPG